MLNRWRGGFGALAALAMLGCGGSPPHAERAATHAASPAEAGREAAAPGATASPGELRYVANEEPSITLVIRESVPGAITGTMSDGAESMPIAARRGPAGLEGTVGPSGRAMPFRASERGGALVVEIGRGNDTQRLTFTRTGAVSGAGATAPGTTGRQVVINQRRLGDAELARVERQYRIRIPDADYWYDRTLGAWGATGGPTMGFIAAGLELGGPLSPDASHGKTEVFVNGRELPTADLGALERITGAIPPGRYFITAAGLAGYEGGPPQWNLAELAAQSGGGGSNTWQSSITGGSGFSDGTTGAVFLPNGGIVSTGN